MNAINDPATTLATQWLAQSDIAGAVALFGDECYWRNLVALTWNIVTPPRCVTFIRPVGP